MAMNAREGMGFFKKDYGWQDQAVAKLMDNISEHWNADRGKFAQAFVVEVSPSGGKSIFSLKAAIAMIMAGLIDKVFWIVPRESIKDGFAQDSRHPDLELPEELQLPGSKTIRVDTELRTNYCGLLSNYHGAVINYQSLDRFLGYFKLLSDSGKRLLFIFDEVHHGKVGQDGEDDDCANEWGKAMAAIRDVAHSVICMTGTPVRSDQQSVAYLKYDKVQYFNPKTGQNVTAYKVRPSFQFTYKDAIAACVARKLIFRPQNPVVSFRYGRDGDYQQFDGELKGVQKALVDRAKKELFSQRNGHIDDMLRLAMEENKRQRRIGDYEAAILVVVGNTDEGNDYNPLVYVASRIKALFGEHAISVESKDDDAAAAIKQFKSSDARWIIAKDMISEGTSIPRVRTVLILRDIKSQVKFEQTVHRATRNRSDEFSQDAIVIFFYLPEMVYFAALIEDAIRLIIPSEKPRCPECRVELEFRVKRGRPCPECGHEPEEVGPPPPPPMDFEWLSSNFGDEVVLQGGDDFSKYDPISRKLLDNLGPNPRYGGRDGINELLRNADANNLISLNGVKSESPFSTEELIDQHWKNYNENCKLAAGPISRSSGADYQETVIQIKGQCKRAAGMSGKTREQVLRDFKDPLNTFQKLDEASKAILQRARGRAA